MQLKLLLTAAFAWQTALLVNIGAPASPEYLRFERTIPVTRDVTPGQTVCAVLDVAAMAHSAPGGRDFRIYRSVVPQGSTSPARIAAYPSAASAVATEVPYVFTESGPEPVDAALVLPTHLSRGAGELHFDISMPPRPYSELQLQLGTAGQDFVGTVQVSAENGEGKGFGKASSLGTFGIFDLRNAGLGLWTTLLMAENTAPLLHLTVTLRTPAGEPIEDVPESLVARVAVPPSRERQTVYTPVATTTSFAEAGGALSATLHVPAHVPVEQLYIALTPGPQANFARDLVLTARSDDDPFHEPEILDAGLLQEVKMPSGDPRLNPIAVRENSFPATLGATLASSATISLAIENGPGPRLPLVAATLEMRQRRLCFAAAPGSRYTLRYGDATLAAPLYAQLPPWSSQVLDVVLEPETRNPGWRTRRDTRSLFERHPEIRWILVLLCAGMMGGTALQFVQYRTEGGAH